MLNWTLLMIGLVLSVGAFHNPLRDPTRHHHRHSERLQVVYETEENPASEFPVASDCNVSGAWYNSLGSELIINVTETGHVTGEFRTAVERELGAAGTGPGLVSGWASHDGSHKALGFSVLWRNGASVTSWAGLCHVCDGLEVMKTTWVLTSEVDTCNDHWSSNRIGQDDFTRYEQASAPGPRRRHNTHTPSDVFHAAGDVQQEEGILSQQQQGIQGI